MGGEEREWLMREGETSEAERPAESVTSLMDRRDWAARLFHANNAKLVGVGVVVVALAYQSSLRWLYAEDSCVGLLEDGRWQGDRVWQPYGCMLHRYRHSDARHCLRRRQRAQRPNTLALVGDARLWDLAKGLLHKLGVEELGPGEPVRDHFLYADPELNLSLAFHRATAVDDGMKSILGDLADGPLPDLLVLGAGLRTIREAGRDPEALDELSFNLTQLRPLLKRLGRPLWMAEPPVLEGCNETAGLRNAAVRAVNERVRAEVGPWLRLWESAALLSSVDAEESEDGLTISAVPLDYDLDVLCNFYCNDLMRFGDGTCCSSPPLPSPTQLSILAAAGGALLLSLAYLLFRCSARMPSLAQLLARRPRAGASGTAAAGAAAEEAVEADGLLSSKVYLAGRLSLLLLYLYACDRGAFFMKENKWYTPLNFVLPTLYLGVLGMFFSSEAGEAEVLSGAQRDEWRGWMQLLILVSHVTGAGERLWARLLVHSLTSAHLFLLGLSHFHYHFNSGDFSLTRFLRVLLRYNLLTALLCVLMRRPYQYYQYIPIATYWYMFLFAILAAPPHITKASCQRNPLHYLFMVVKLLVFFGLVSVLYLSEEFFHRVFSLSVWRGLFVDSKGEGIGGWWLSWWTHRYSAGAGVATGLGLEWVRGAGLVSERREGWLLGGRLGVGLGLAGLTGLGLFGVGLGTCEEAETCLHLLAYLVPVPLLGYAALRNVWGPLRTRLSHFFVWWGRLSVELWVVSWEGWLTADGQGVLVLWPRWNVFNLITVSALLLVAAHEARVLTLSLLPVLLPSQPHALLRNLLLLPLLLLALFLASQHLPGPAIAQT